VCAIIDPDLDIDVYLDTRHLMAFGSDGMTSGRHRRLRDRDMARINLDHIRHAYGIRPTSPQ
jgi:hypothetical protein